MMVFFGLKYAQNLEDREAHPHQEFPGVSRGVVGHDVYALQQVSFKS